jgi:bifunctional non-homologous end joining protein LigD
MTKPMLLQTLKDVSKLKNYEGGWYAQEKMDGTRVIVEKKYGIISMQTRSGKSELSSNYPEITTELKRCIGDNFILDAELVFYDDNNMPVFLTGLAKDARKDCTPYLMVFDILEYEHLNYRTYTQEQRNQYVRYFIEARCFKYIKAIDTFTDDFDGLYNSVLACGGEGIVLKKATAIYQEGARSKDWLKVKHQETHDCFIIGLKKGKGKYTDTFGSLVIGQYTMEGKLIVVGACSGFDDATRKYLYDIIMAQPTEHVFNVTKRTEYHYVKRVAPKYVIVVECMERLKSGAMRHPRFVVFRDDKAPEECMYVP